ncbi:VOC family protein [Phycicoccus flavus]|uniref:VOC family protein n=1 Tax=Phycicoccus flavus TaxID=2502783 RepID=UPI000FEBB8BE|nr:VOC family protein [Phycicoccus flavus]NHA69929.1 VOC family protein [Phycicoccus flavus]
MARVTGIGGFFFAARDPDALTDWYDEHLGVRPPPAEYGLPSWRQEAGTTVLAAFDAGAEHLEGRPWALNFRVDDLDGMVAALRDAGVEVAVHSEAYPNGRFADLHDPEGNPVQLWEPAGVDA